MVSLPPTTTTTPPGDLDLVTGGAGFIGSHLVEHLLAAGRRVRVLDDLSSGTLDNLPQHPALDVVVGDAAHRPLVEGLLADAARVFHLAGAVGVAELARDPVGAMERNLEPTRVVLAAAAARHLPTLYTSSSEVYGAGAVPFREAAPPEFGCPTEPRGGYACAKAMGEWLALGRHRASGWPVVVARLFNTVGPRQSGRWGMVLPRFVRQALSGEPLTIYGSGRQTRCFAHVTDVVAILAALADDPAAIGQIVNVGSRREISVEDLARTVCREVGRPVELSRRPFAEVYPTGVVDPPRRVPCLRKLDGLLTARGLGHLLPDRAVDAIVAAVVAAERAPEARDPEARVTDARAAADGQSPLQLDR